MLVTSSFLATVCIALLANMVCRGAASDIIVSNHPQCTKIGKDLMKRHASVEQIYVAVSLCEGIVHPMDSGLGGGFQAVLYDYANNRRVAKYLMSREYSPYSKAFTKKPLLFGNSVGIPSVLAGYARLLGVTDCLVTSPQHTRGAKRSRLKHYSPNCIDRIKSGVKSGVLDALHHPAHLNKKNSSQRSRSPPSGVPYREIFYNCTRLARYGFRVSPTFDAMYSYLPSLDRLITYNKVTGTAINLRLARFIEFLSKDPLHLLDPYVEWENRRIPNNENMRKAMIEDVRYFNSHLNHRDFLSYKAQLRPALSVPFRYHNVTYKLITMPSPAGGEAIAFFAKMIETIGSRTSRHAINHYLNKKQISMLFVLCSRFAYAVKPYFRQLKSSTKRDLITHQAPRIARKLYRQVSRANDTELIALANRRDYRIPSTFGSLRLPQIRVSGSNHRSELQQFDDDNADNNNIDDDNADDDNIDDDNIDDDNINDDNIDVGIEEEEEVFPDDIMNNATVSPDPSLYPSADDDLFADFIDSMRALNVSSVYEHIDNDDNAENDNGLDDVDGGVDSNPYGTTNVIVKRGQRAIVATSSINHSYGSGIMSTRLGIFYNNVLRDFTPNTWYQRSWYRNGTKKFYRFPNRAKVHSVPQSSMGCTLLVNPTTNNPVFGIGGAGGFKITGGIFNVLWNYFIQGYSLNRSVNRLRLITKINYKRNLTELWYELPPQINQTLLASKDNPTSGKVQLGFSDSDMPHSIDFFYRHRGPLNVMFIKEAGYSAITAFTTLRNTTVASFDARRGGKNYVAT